MLCSQIIHYLEQSHDKNDTLILYMYLDYKDKERQSLANLTGSLIKQIVQHQQFSFPPGELNDLFLASREGEAKAEQSDMLRILREQFRAYSKIFVVADGLNDVDDAVRDGLDHLFSDLLMTEDDTPANNVSVMVTARFSEDESALYTVTCTVCEAKELRVYRHCYDCERDDKHFDLCESCVAEGERCGHPCHSLEEPQRVYMLVQAGDDEIRQFVESEMSKRTKQDRYQRSQRRIGSTSLGGTSLARRLESRPDLGQQLCDEIVQKSQGSYLLANLYLEDIASRTDVKQIKDALLGLPEGLGGVYHDKMKRIEMQSEYARKVGMATLYWIVYTSRPLKFAEIQHALAIRVGQPFLDEREKTGEADMILYTAGLVTVAADKTAVRIHLSLHEYLKEQGQQWFPEAELEIAKKLLTYLNYEAMTRPFSTDPGDSIQNRLEKFPLLSYAALYWNDHVASVCSHPDVQPLLFEFLGNPSRIDLCVQVSYALQSKFKIDLDVRRGVTGLHLAALYGLTSIIPDLVSKKGLDIDAIDPKYEQTALMYASKNGHVSTVKALLDLGASINVRSARESSAFLEAFTGNTDDHIKIVELLLEQSDLDVNTRYADEGDRTVLMMSTFPKFDREEVVKLLLHKPGIHANLKDFNGDTALSLATTNGNAAIVRRLLTHPKIDINSVNNSSISALTIAAKSNSFDIVDQLLERQAVTSLKDGEEGCTAFFSAIEAGSREAIKSFSTHRKNDLYTVDSKQRTTLHAACASGDLAIVRLILHSDLAKSSRASGGQTPLHEACRGGHIDVIRTLLQKGVDPTITDNQKRTPLRVAWENGNEDAVRWMQDPQNISGDLLSERLPPLTSLPIWSLAKSNRLDILQEEIIRRGKEDNSGCGATTDQAVTFDLVEQNPDTGDTALHYAITNEQPKILRWLLEANVPVDLPNHLKRTPLHLAANSRDPELTEMLLQHSPNLDFPDIVGLTPLLTAQKQEKYDIAVLLIAAGASTKDCHRAHIQRTFFAAVELGYADVAGKLIAKGADHLRQNTQGLTAKQIALAHDDVDMVRVLDMQKSFFLPLRSSTQRSRDFESATTPPMHNGPFAPDFGLSPFRTRPSMPGSFFEDVF